MKPQQKSSGRTSLLKRPNHKPPDKLDMPKIRAPCKLSDETKTPISTSLIQPPIQGTISISDCEAESALHLSNISFGLQYDRNGKLIAQQAHQEIICRRIKERDKQVIRCQPILSSKQDQSNFADLPFCKPHNKNESPIRTSQIQGNFQGRIFNADCEGESSAQIVQFGSGIFVFGLQNVHSCACKLKVARSIVANQDTTTCFDKRFQLLRSFAKDPAISATAMAQIVSKCDELNLRDDDNISTLGWHMIRKAISDVNCHMDHQKKGIFPNMVSQDH